MNLSRLSAHFRGRIYLPRVAPSIALRLCRVAAGGMKGNRFHQSGEDFNEKLYGVLSYCGDSNGVRDY
jgi:hypothetical protein